MKIQGALLCAVVSLTLVVLPGSATASGTNRLAGCGNVDWPSLAESDSAYPDAMDLSQTLINHGVIVTCISPSKMTDTFEGQQGAAFYSTNEGDFEALFMPKPQNFNKLRVIERQDGRRYLYSFAGQPEPWSANLIDSAYRLYFVRHGNELIVAQDPRVATRIKGAINGR